MGGYIGSQIPSFIADVTSASGDFAVGDDLTVDTNTLYVDSTNNRVGVGTSSPNNVLEVRGTSSGQNVLQLSNSAGTSDGNAENQIRVTCNGNANWANLDIQAYQTIFTQNGTERMRIDSAGRVTMPYQPFFRGNLLANVSPNTTVNAPGNAITSLNVQENVGSHWNNTTGTWTCPVAGKYMVSAYMIKYPVSGASHVDLYKNGTYVEARIRAEETATYTQAGGMIYLTCAANDTIQWKYFGTAGLHSYNGAWTIGLVG